MANLTSGIPAFDESLGGLPAGSIILFIGEADTGMTTCAQQILYQGLRDGRPGVYFTTGRSWEDIVGEMEGFGWGLDAFFQRRKMWFIDSFGMKKERTAGEVSWDRSEEHTSELQSRENLVCRLLLEKKNVDMIYAFSLLVLHQQLLHQLLQ